MFLSNLFKSFSNQLWRLSKKLGPYAPLVAMMLLGLVILSVSRLGLVLWKLDRVNATGKLLEILLQGIRVDIIQLGLLTVIPLLLAPILATRHFFNFWRKFTIYLGDFCHCVARVFRSCHAWIYCRI